MSRAKKKNTRLKMNKFLRQIAFVVTFGVGLYFSLNPGVLGRLGLRAEKESVLVFFGILAFVARYYRRAYRAYSRKSRKSRRKAFGVLIATGSGWVFILAMIAFTLNLELGVLGLLVLVGFLLSVVALYVYYMGRINFEVKKFRNALVNDN
jgi:drug/metabolite transporter (DMT)-like permease